MCVHSVESSKDQAETGVSNSSLVVPIYFTATSQRCYLSGIIETHVTFQGVCVTYLDVMVQHSVCCVLPSAGTPAGVLARPGRPLQAEASLARACCTTVTRTDRERLRSQQGIMGVEVLQRQRSAGTLLGGRRRGGGRGPRVTAQAAILAALQHPTTNGSDDCLRVGGSLWRADAEKRRTISQNKRQEFSGVIGRRQVATLDK